MLKVKKYFEDIGFVGDDLEKIVHAFELKTFKKNDFVVEEGKTSRAIRRREAARLNFMLPVRRRMA